MSELELTPAAPETKVRRLPLGSIQQQEKAIERCLREVILRFLDRPSESGGRTVAQLSGELRRIKEDSQIERRIDELEEMLGGDSENRTFTAIAGLGEGSAGSDGEPEDPIAGGAGEGEPSADEVAQGGSESEAALAGAESKGLEES